MWQTFTEWGISDCETLNNTKKKKKVFQKELVMEQQGKIKAVVLQDILDKPSQM